MNANAAEPWVEIVRQRVAGLRFGSVQITVHEGRVTQVEATEKTRLPVEPPPAGVPAPGTKARPSAGGGL